MTVQIINGEALETLHTLPDGSVNCIVTSPPYYGLRDYGTATWQGGDPGCQHEIVNARRLPWANEVKGAATAEGGKNGTGYAMMTKEAGGECGKCGALRIDRQIGLEETPEQFVAALVEVFREARRVLRDDGVAFINIGDSYARDARKGRHKPGDSGKQDYVITDGGGRAASGINLRSESKGSSDGGVGRHDRAAVPNGGSGLKPKDLIGIPWMLAFALRADGWYLRQDIIWSKPNPMPESVTDRCTKSHEHVFMLSKSERYYFDQQAIAEPVSDFSSIGRELPRDFEDRGDDVRGRKARVGGGAETRNKRDVWIIPTEPSTIAHYAMMPTKLAMDCILAGCAPGGTVLDPFGGAGTTGLVAAGIGRNAILIELGADHAETAKFRIGLLA